MGPPLRCGHPDEYREFAVIWGSQDLVFDFCFCVFQSFVPVLGDTNGVFVPKS